MVKQTLTLLSVSIALFAAGCAPQKSHNMPFAHQGDVPSEICFSQNLTDVNAARHAQHAAAVAQQQGSALVSNQEAFHANAPKTYTVKKGDTLWDISRRFLSKPWYWKKIWHNNPHIKNPHRIYPGDVISIVMIDGEPRLSITGSSNQYHGDYTGRRTKDGRQIVKYAPHVREVKGAESIALAGSVLEDHILKTRLYNPSQVSSLPFVYGSGMEYITLTAEQEIFAKGLEQALEGSAWEVFRPANIVVDPTDKSEEPRIFGQEMRYIGKVQVTGQDSAQNVTRLQIVDVVDVMKEGDVLLPAEENQAATYFPQLPAAQCSRGYFVLNTSTLPTIKEFDSVVTSFGRDNGAQVGDIWKIVRPGAARVVNGQKLSTPEKELGYLMIYRVEDQVSFGFVLESSQNIYMSDALVRP